MSNQYDISIWRVIVIVDAKTKLEDDPIRLISFITTDPISLRSFNYSFYLFFYSIVTNY